VEVLSEVHALAQAQWARQNAAKLLLASTFLTGAKMAMRQNHPLLKMEQLLFLLSGIAQDAFPAGQDKNNPPSPIKNEPYKTHLAYVKERRTEAEAKKILEAALKKLRAEDED